MSRRPPEDSLAEQKISDNVSRSFCCMSHFEKSSCHSRGLVAICRDGRKKTELYKRCCRTLDAKGFHHAPRVFYMTAVQHSNGFRQLFVGLFFGIIIALFTWTKWYVMYPTKVQGKDQSFTEYI